MATLIDVLMPEVGEGVTEATIVEWNFAVGEQLSKGDALVEIMTDKVNMEVEAEVAGRLSEILAEAEEEVRVGSVIGRLAAS